MGKWTVQITVRAFMNWYLVLVRIIRDVVLAITALTSGSALNRVFAFHWEAFNVHITRTQMHYQSVSTSSVSLTILQYTLSLASFSTHSPHAKVTYLILFLFLSVVV